MSRLGFDTGISTPRNYCLRIQSKVYSERYLHTEEEPSIRRRVNCREAEMHLLGHDRIRDATDVLPGFLKEAVSQIEVFWIVYHLCQINHGEVDTTLQSNRHAIG